MQLAGNSRIRPIIWAQFGTTIVVSLVLVLLGDLHAWSSLIGGLISASVNGLMALKVFVPYRAQDPAEVLARIFGAEMQKLLLTGILFATVILTVQPLSIVALLGTYLFVQVAVPIMVLYCDDRLMTRCK